MSIFDRFTGKKIPAREEIERQAKDWISKDYKTFIREEHPEEEGGFLKYYVNAARTSEKIFKMRTPFKMTQKMSQDLMMADLNVTPDQVLSLTILSMIVLFVAIIPILLLLPTMVIFFPFLPFVLAYFIYTYPNYLSMITKIRASDETVKVILYMVIYLRLNPQIEGAMEFAAAHLTGPIGKDLKKIIWDLHVRKYVTINQAIGSTIEKWLLWDKNFVEAMNLIQGLSLETNDVLREKTLDKTLNYILDSTYEKMKDYSRDLRTPIMMLHTMGITFPIMGLVMFPMIAIFLYQTLDPNYLIFGYIVVLPAFLYFFLRRTISKRPGAFSYPDISHHPDLPPKGKFLIAVSGKRYYLSTKPLAIIITLILLIPSLVYFTNLLYDYLTLKEQKDFTILWKDRIKQEYDHAFEFSVYSLSGIWAMGLGLSIYFLGESYQRLKIRNEVKMIEDEFQIGLFRLGDVLSSGIPVETALEETLQKYRQYRLEGSPMYMFFLTVLKNIREMGMTLKNAVFDKNYGVLLRYPSLLIKDVMQIVVSAAEKSSMILSTASRTISTFLMRTKNVENLLKELLDEVSAAIQLQANFIAPFICGIVGGMATFIIRLLEKISEFLGTIEQQFNMGGTFVHSGTMKFGELMSFMKIEEIIPATVFQMVVGIYMIEIVMILAYFQNGIKNGFDRTTRNVLIGKALITGLILYSIVLLIGVYISGPLLGAVGGLGNVGAT